MAEIDAALDKERITEGLNELKRARGLTSAKIAESIGWSAQTVQKLMAGERAPTLDQVVALAAFFRVPIARLVYPDGAPWPQHEDADGDEAVVLQGFREQRAQGLTASQAVAAMALRWDQVYRQERRTPPE